LKVAQAIRAFDPYHWTRRLLFWGRNGCAKAYSFIQESRGNIRRLALWTPQPYLT